MRIDWTRILWNFGEDMCYQTQMPFVFVILFSDIGQCFWPVLKTVLKIKNPATLGYFWIKYCIFSTHFKSLNCCRLLTRYKQQQTEFRNYRQTDIPYFCLTRAYIWSIWVYLKSKPKLRMALLNYDNNKDSLISSILLFLKVISLLYGIHMVHI